MPLAIVARKMLIRPRIDMVHSLHHSSAVHRQWQSETHTRNRRASLMAAIITDSALLLNFSTDTQKKIFKLNVRSQLRCQTFFACTEAMRLCVSLDWNGKMMK